MKHMTRSRLVIGIQLTTLSTEGLAFWSLVEESDKIPHYIITFILHPIFVNKLTLRGKSKRVVKGSSINTVKML